MNTSNNIANVLQRPMTILPRYLYLIDKYIYLFVSVALLLSVVSAPAGARQHTEIDTIRSAARQFIVAELSGGAGEQALTDTTVTI